MLFFFSHFLSFYLLYYHHHHYYYLRKETFCCTYLFVCLLFFFFLSLNLTVEKYKSKRMGMKRKVFLNRLHCTCLFLFCIYSYCVRYHPLFDLDGKGVCLEHNSTMKQYSNIWQQEQNEKIISNVNLNLRIYMKSTEKNYRFELKIGIYSTSVQYLGSPNDGILARTRCIQQVSPLDMLEWGK